MLPSFSNISPKNTAFYNTLEHFMLYFFGFGYNYIYNKHLYNIDLINNPLKYIKFNNNISI